MDKVPPRIFCKRRKLARRKRAAEMLHEPETALFLLNHLADDLFDRISFLRFTPQLILVEGFDAEGFANSEYAHGATLHSTGFADFDEGLPNTSDTYDLVASLNSLDTVNDLPGALIQMRALLKPGGLAMANFVGGQSLPKLRRAMHDADADRPAARMHPLINPQSCPALLSRAGWRNPVVDSHRLTVRYASFDRLVQDLREQALGNILASRAPALTRHAVERARASFHAQADEDGKVSETFEIITLTGWR